MLSHSSDNIKEVRAAGVLQKKPRFELFIEVSMHIITWAYIFLSPLFFKHRVTLLIGHDTFMVLYCPLPHV